MKKLKLVVFGLVAMLGFSTANTKVVAEVNASKAEIPLSVKNYVPDKYDFHDYWGGIGDIDPEYGDGITTFAHVTGFVPLKANAIKMKTSMMIYSKHTVENGGDNIDCWLTYSFSKEPGGSADNSFPYFAGVGEGYFLHIDNYSGTTAPNCVGVSFVKRADGAFSNVVPNFFVDNIVTNPVGSANENAEIVFWLELVKVDTKFTLRFTNAETNVVLKEVTDITLDETLLANELGQTFFSTAIYEGPGCDGKHWEHRAVKVYSFDAYTYDASNAEITLDSDTFVYDGGAHRPEVTVKIGDYVLLKDLDYYLEGNAVTEIGQGTVRINFINEFAGNPMVEKTFNVVPIDASAAIVTLEAEQFEFTGQEIKPVVESVVLGEDTLVADIDYTVSYENNIEVGTGKVVITFKGYYSGVVNKTFAIVAEEEPPVNSEEPSEPPVDSEEPPVSSAATEEPPAEEPKRGCFGTIATPIITSVLLLGLAGVISLRKKRK